MLKDVSFPDAFINHANKKITKAINKGFYPKLTAGQMLDLFNELSYEDTDIDDISEKYGLTYVDEEYSL